MSKLPNTDATRKAIQNGESLAMNELANKAGIQNRKYRYSLPFRSTLTAAGTAGDQTIISLNISGEGDFYAMKFGAKMVCGDPAITSGLLMQIKETGYNKQLFRDFVDTTLLASPGFGVSFYPMIDFEQLFLSNSDIQIELKNTTAEAITILGVWHGWQFIGSARSIIPGYAE